MPLSPLSAINPVDGRYYEKTKQLADYFSEYGLIRYRLQAEIQWVKTLAACPQCKEIPPLSADMETYLDQLFIQFSIENAEEIKELEKTLNHDVKCVETYLRGKFKQHDGLAAYSHIIHIACTSEDINSTAYALMLRDASQQVLLPELKKIEALLQQSAEKNAGLAMLSLTHGQPASPTTLGKELANFCYRLHRHIQQIEAIPMAAKWGGAVGNYNAHLSAWPDADWPEIAQQHLKSLGLEHIPYTTQIEPHEHLAELLNAYARAAQTLIDLCRDIWAYIARGVLVQKANDKEVGSSTMPHKVNPIDFENAEGNLGIAVALADHLSRKLVVSRWQRDLSDSTSMRALGSVFGHLIIATGSIQKGHLKITPDTEYLSQELAKHPEVLGEAIQTVMRKHGADDAYEQLKVFSRGKALTAEDFKKFIKSIDLPKNAKDALLALTPETYTGLAETLALSLKDHLK